MVTFAGGNKSDYRSHKGFLLWFQGETLTLRYSCSWPSDAIEHMSYILPLPAEPEEQLCLLFWKMPRYLRLGGSTQKLILLSLCRKQISLMQKGCLLRPFGKWEWKGTDFRDAHLYWDIVTSYHEDREKKWAWMPGEKRRMLSVQNCSSYCKFQGEKCFL